MRELIAFVLERSEVELLYAELSDLADTKRADANDGYGRKVGEALNDIADQMHSALSEGDDRDAS